MQIPKQIYFKQTTPKGGKLTATIEGDDLPNIVQVKGTNDINEVKRRREHDRPDGWGERNEYDRREDDDEYDRDERGCHKSTVGVWESENKYTTLKQTLLFIKKRNCVRVVQEASYDAQGKLIVVVPTATIKDGSIALVDKTIEIKWTSVQEILVKQYNVESKLSTSTTWKNVETELPMGVGTAYSSSETPTATGSYEYRINAVFVDNSTSTLLASQPISVVIPTGGSVTINNFVAQYNPDALTIDTSWTSVTEVSLLTYSVQIKGANDPDFYEAASADAFGPSQSYAASIFADSGDYTLRLVGNYLDGNSAVIEGTTVQVAVPVV